MNESNKIRIAHLAGPAATIQNTPPLVTSNKTGAKHGFAFARRMRMGAIANPASPAGLGSGELFDDFVLAPNLGNFGGRYDCVAGAWCRQRRTAFRDEHEWRLLAVALMFAQRPHFLTV